MVASALIIYGLKPLVTNAYTYVKNGLDAFGNSVQAEDKFDYKKLIKFVTSYKPGQEQLQAISVTTQEQVQTICEQVRPDLGRKILEFTEKLNYIGYLIITYYLINIINFVLPLLYAFIATLIILALSFVNVELVNLLKKRR